MPELAFGRHQNCFLLVQGRKPAPDEEWGSWVHFVRQGGLASGRNIRVLVFSAGGNPTPKQRQLIHQLMPQAGGGVSTAVVLDSAVGRAVVSAMALFNRGVRAFRPDRVSDAFDYLGVRGAARDELFELARHKHLTLNLPFIARL